MATTLPPCQRDVTIPSNVAEIPYRAYFGCTALVNLVLHSAIISVGNEAFSGCTSLTSDISLPGLQTLGVSAFRGSDIRSADLGQITTVSEYAFYYCHSLEWVKAPNANVIGKAAFARAWKMTEATLSPVLTSIGASAFAYARVLETPLGLSQLTTIPKYGFLECYKLNTSLDLPYVTSIEEGGFLLTTALARRLYAPQLAVDGLGVSAFSISGVLSADLGDALSTIPSYVFYYCYSLEWVRAPNVAVIGGAAFARAWKMTEATFRPMLTSIGASSFEMARVLETPLGLSQLTTIPKNAFKECFKLNTSLDLPYVTSIEEGGFQQTTALARRLYAPQLAVDGLGVSAFSISGVLAADLGDALSTIPSNAFYWCYYIEWVRAPNVAVIGGAAFARAWRMTEATLHPKLTTIGDYAFQFAYKLTTRLGVDDVMQYPIQCFYETRSLPCLPVHPAASVHSQAFLLSSALTCDPPSPPAPQPPPATPPPATPPPCGSSCGEGTVFNAVSQQCEIECSGGRMLEALPVPARSSSPQEVAARLLTPGADITTELGALTVDDVAKLLLQPSVQHNPSLISRLANQLFRQPALVHGERVSA